MPEPTPFYAWLDDISVLAALLWIVGVVAVLGFVKKVYDAVKPFADSAREFFEDWNGRPKRAGVPAVPGVMARLERIEKEITPNSGTSAHDKITRRIGNLDAKVDALFAHLSVEPPVGESDPD